MLRSAFPHITYILKVTRRPLNCRLASSTRYTSPVPFVRPFDAIESESHPRMLSTALQPIAAHQLLRTTTHEDYARYDFELPENRYVGLLACQRDPLLSSLATIVTKVSKKAPEPVAAAPPSKNKKSTKASAEASVPVAQDDIYEVELRDTVLFPEGGGQPSDTGHISLVGDNETLFRVQQVLRKGLDAVHYVVLPNEAQLKVGDQVLVQVDMERRLDLMRCHTGQHLLSAVIDKQLELDTLSWTLTPFPDPCYIELSRAPTPTEIQRIEKTCNDHINAALPINVSMILTSSLGGKVPENYKDFEGSDRLPVLRTVSIDQIDSNPCCGTHYPNTSHLKMIHISPYTTPIRGTNARIYFALAERVLDLFKRDEEHLKAVAGVMGCSNEQLSERIANMKTNYEATVKREKRLKDELTGFISDGVWNRSKVENGVRKALLFRQEDSTNGLEFLSAISLALKDRIAEGEEKKLFILASGGTIAAGGGAGHQTSGGGALLVFGDEGLVLKAGKLISAKFGSRTRGGGKGRWQGKLVGEKWEKGDDTLLKQILDEATAEVA